VLTWLSLDKRSLALLRICLSVGILVDIIVRGLYFRAHYTSAGLLPLADFLGATEAGRQKWSAFFISDHPSIVACLFILYFLSALFLACGYKTRYAGWLCWLMAVSIYRRNPLVADAGDLYLCALLLWGNFLPWGERFGLDSPTSEDDDKVLSVPAFCYLTQIAIVYWFSAVLRVGKEWQVDFSALYYALHLDPLTLPTAPYLLALGSPFLKTFTFLTLFFEMVGPVLLFLPGQRLRLLCVTAIVLFHGGILATIHIPVFAVLGAIAPLGLLPSLFWELKPGIRLSGVLSKASRYRSEAPSGLDSGLVPTWLRTVYYQALPVLFLLVIILHLRAGIASRRPSTPVSYLAEIFSLDQRWGMFSPHPVDLTGWETARAQLASGKVVDLMDGEEYSVEPDAIKHRTGWLNNRWRLFHQAVSTYRRSDAIALYLEYLVERWNSAHPQDPVVVAEYRYHPRGTDRHYLLSEQWTEVLSVYRSPR